MEVGLPDTSALHAPVAFTALAAGCLIAVHLFAHRLRRLDRLPRSRWLSLAGGASVSYVFLHLLPEIAEGQRIAGGAVGFLETELIWSFALTGLVLFYVLEARIRAADPGEVAAVDAMAEQTEGTTKPSIAAIRGYHLHMASFAAYTMIVGYLIVRREDADPVRLAFFTLAMGLHFLVTDAGLRRDTPRRWVAHGRFIIAGAMAAGWAIGLWLELPEAVISCLVAFLGGGVILNVMKEELPHDRQSRLLPFVAGAAGYAVLLVASR